VKKLIFLLLVVLAISGCAKREKKDLTVIFGTRLGDSGIAFFIQEEFEKRYGIKIKPRYRCMEMAVKEIKEGGVDVLLHAHPNIKILEEEGMVMGRKPVMESQWVLVGPPSDPAGVGNTKNIFEALRKIYKCKAPFLSRGDLSCQNTKEKQLWETLRIKPEGEWYIISQLSNLPSLRMASQMECYYLADEPTFLAERDFLHLKVFIKGEDILKDRWEVMIINPKNFSVNYRKAKKVVEFLTSPDFQQKVKEWGKDRFGVAPYSPVFPIKTAKER